MTRTDEPGEPDDQIDALEALQVRWAAHASGREAGARSRNCYGQRDGMPVLRVTGHDCQRLCRHALPASLLGYPTINHVR